MFYESVILKQGISYSHIMLLIQESLHEHFHFNGNNFGNKQLRKNAYSNILKISPTKTENFQIKKL